MAADFSPYVSLTVHDVQPVDIYLGAIELARRTLPEFSLRQGTPEDALFQAFAYMSALSVGSINRLPSRLMEGLVRMAGMERRYGSRAQVVVDLTARDNESETVIPAGTVFAYIETVGGISTQFTYQSAEDIVIPSHATTPQTVQAVLYSQAVGIHPVMISGEILTPLSVVSDLDSVVVATSITIVDPPDDTYPFVNGLEPESDITYLNRARTFLAGLNETLVTAKQVQSYILANYSNVGRCLVRDLTKYDETGASGSTRIGGTDKPGYATVYVYGNKQLLPQNDRGDIATDVTAKSVAGLTINVDNFHEVSVDIEIEIIFDSQFTQESIEILVREFIFNAISRESFPLAEQHLRTSFIASVASRVDGVLSVGRVTLLEYADADSGGSAAYSLNSNGDVEFIYKATLPIIGKAAKTVDRATTVALPACTYNNGTAGVGATLTADTNGLLSVDGGSVTSGDRILVKNQAATKQNGIYVVTQAGSTGSAPFILTRATDYDDTVNFVVGRAILVEGGGTLAGDIFAVDTITGSLEDDDIAVAYEDITATHVVNNNGFSGAIMIKATGRTA